MRELGIDLGKATTKDANAPSKKIKNNLGILFMVLVGNMFSVLPSGGRRFNRNATKPNEDQLQGLESGSRGSEIGRAHV